MRQEMEDLEKKALDMMVELNGAFQKVIHSETDVAMVKNHIDLWMVAAAVSEVLRVTTEHLMARVDGVTASDAEKMLDKALQKVKDKL